jgi:hypothetical protein
MVTVVRVDRDTFDFIRFRAGLPLGSYLLSLYILCTPRRFHAAQKLNAEG